MSKRIKKDDFVEDDGVNSRTFSLVADYDGNEQGLFEASIDDELMPVLPVRNMVLFPTVILPVSIGRKSSLKLIKDYEEKGKNIAVFCQRVADKDAPGFFDLYPVGVVAKIVRVLEMPDRSTTVILQGIQRIKLLSIESVEPYLMGRIELFPEILPPPRSREFKAVVDSCRDMAVKYIEMSDSMAPDAAFALKNLRNGVLLVEFVCSNLSLEIKDKVKLIKEPSLLARAMSLLNILSREVQLSELKLSIQKRTHEDIEKQQKEYFLQQQIKNIQDELGGSVQDQDVEEMRQKAAGKKWSKEVAELFRKELAKLERINTQSPDYNVQLSYLQTVLGLPWGEYTIDNTDMQNAAKALNKDHYGLEKVKERILEHLAVMKLRNDFKSPIICLYGPPGVGKTSLGVSIAKALRRKYVRVSLGGLHDESEIRGHRRTYIGAMPGRIIKGLSKAGSSNPVFVLDEIDKVSQMTVQGDPSSALLEVLDPEQNGAFHDNYLDIDYDLSRVMFIATANNLNTIPGPLLDRMEVIEVSGYITEEKVEIASRHLIPKELEANGLRGRGVSIPKKTIEDVIENYTRESGVRELEKKIGKICRRMAYKFANDGKFESKVVKSSDLKGLLGVKPYSRDKYQGNEYAGVVTGLAWTAVGGEILFVETSLSRGKEGRLTLTGNLGDVMKESAMLAVEFIRSHASLLGLDPELFKYWNIHIHVPEGAIPKDGPSAGVTMATSIASAFTQRKVKANLAMTGEITLRGKVLPVGGIREKILAAKRAGITDIVLCSENQRDIDEIPQEYLNGLEFHYVENISDVWDIALLPDKVENPQEITVPEHTNEV